jgi:hypothetical protein
MPNDSTGMGPVLAYHWEPIDKNQSSIVDVTASGSVAAGDEISERIMAAIRLHRPEVAHRLIPSRSTTVLDIFGSDPVTSQVYRWLWDDLASAGWLSGPAPYSETDNVVGAKFAGMRIVRLDSEEK